MRPSAIQAEKVTSTTTSGRSHGPATDRATAEAPSGPFIPQPPAIQQKAIPIDDAWRMGHGVGSIVFGALGIPGENLPVQLLGHTAASRGIEFGHRSHG